MKNDNKNPLGIDDKLYTVEEFGSAVINKYGEIIIFQMLF